jgi:hypothetical protein
VKGTTTMFKRVYDFEKAFQGKEKSLFPPSITYSREPFRLIEILTPFTQYWHVVYCSSRLTGRRDP